jgi:colanic acid/amylovoran biosynthesis glycosyltransferase
MPSLQSIFSEVAPETCPRQSTLRVAYLSNRFPSPVEPYVSQEIEELRRRGVRIIAGSVNKPHANQSAREFVAEVVLMPFRLGVLLRAVWLGLRRWSRISDLIGRILFRGNESPLQRAKALIHTWLGACYAVFLEDYEIDHIHVHHGYFGSWIAMVAARLLDRGFSMTLHGSDLLLHAKYLDIKLKSCQFCLTISEYNRAYILKHYPRVNADKILVSRLGVDPGASGFVTAFGAAIGTNPKLSLLSIGRLHATKDHAFLLRACAQLQARGIDFECSIAGEGAERRNLESLIRKYGLEDNVALLGHVEREQMDSLYQRADLVVLTSRSEGVPLVLMEAMAHGKLVLAPAITGIPELVLAGKTGFLYEPGSLGDFIARLIFVASLLRRTEKTRRTRSLSSSRQLDWVRHGARVQVVHHFNRAKNLESFADLFMRQTFVRHAESEERSARHESLVLQQI